METVESLQLLLLLIKENPMSTIIIAIGVGVILGVGKLLYYFAQKKIDAQFTSNIDESKIEEIENQLEDRVDEIMDKLHEEFPIIKHRELPPLTESPLFPSIKWMETIIKTNLSTGNKGKDLILQEIGIKKLEAWEKYLYELSKEVENCFCTCHSSKDNCNKLFEANIRAFDKAFKEYNNFWHNNDDYTEDEKWCLEYVMPIINKYHQQNVDDTMNAIKYACDSKYYDSCISRQATIFLTYLGALNKFVNEMCVSFETEINGKLTGRVFKNTVI